MEACGRCEQLWIGERTRTHDERRSGRELPWSEQKRHKQTQIHVCSARPAHSHSSRASSPARPWHILEGQPAALQHHGRSPAPRLCLSFRLYHFLCVTLPRQSPCPALAPMHRLQGLWCSAQSLACPLSRRSYRLVWSMEFRCLRAKSLWV